MHCSASPRCEHHWFYDFRVNRRRYRNTTETADKQAAKKFEATERTRILEGRHGIRKQPDISFRDFAATYLRDYADVQKRSASRDHEIVAVLNRWFGAVILHELTAHRIEQFKRERLAGKWRGHGTKGAAKTIKPGTVNRELDTLRGILTKAVEWRKLRESPMATVERLKVDNQRTRILSDTEQEALLEAAPGTLGRAVRLALITSARIGELLQLKWEHVSDHELVFMQTKNGRARRLPIGPTLAAALEDCPKGGTWVFTNPRTRKAYTVNGLGHVFRRAAKRAGITSGDVTLHTLRHTTLSRMVAAGIDDHTVKQVGGHSSTRMLERYTHPTVVRQIDALETFSVGRIRAEQTDAPAGEPGQRSESGAFPKEVGGRQEDRTPDLRIANAALSQLS